MPKLNSQKQWQKDKPEKVKEYTQKYLANKARIFVVVPMEVATHIDKIKDPSESRPEWVKKLILERLNGTQP